MGKRLAVNPGDRFGKLTIIKEIDQITARRFLCKCDCGNTSIVRLNNLTGGTTKSCGCLHSEAIAARNFEHGMCGTRLYRIWAHMVGRCCNPKDARYALYGGRGIKLCPEWKSFKSFYSWAMGNGYSELLTIDRINCNGHYEPQNCRWATWKQQQNNRTNNALIIHNGKTLTRQQWAEVTGISADTIKYRLKSGWSIPEALETPLRGCLN